MFSASSGSRAKASGITICCNKDPLDFPNLADGFSVLHNTIIHCLPLGQFFTEPVYVTIAIPPWLASASGIGRLSLQYSATDVDETPLWKSFKQPVWCPSGDVRFVEETADEDHANEAVTSLASAELVLALYHFCTFAVVVDGRDEHIQKTFLGGFMKVNVGMKAMVVEVLILVGCCEKSMVRITQRTGQVLLASELVLYHSHSHSTLRLLVSEPLKFLFSSYHFASINQSYK